MTNRYYNKFKRFESALSSGLPGFQVKPKDESKPMKIISWILYPFNRSFLDSFTTTIDNIVYMPRPMLEEMSDYSPMVILAHEYCHAKDAQKISKVLFGLLYLLPQILAPAMLLLLLVYWPLALVLAAVCLAPIPAYFRMKYELAGYTMSLFMHNELLKAKKTKKSDRYDKLHERADFYNEQFTGPSYYFMWPFGVRDKLSEVIDKIMSNNIINDDDIYQEVLNAYNGSKTPSK